MVIQTKLTGLAQKAAYFAAERHRDQKRKYTNDPYIVHPVAVAEILLWNGADEATVAAAFLHDVLEDTQTTYAELVDAFGHEVAVLVWEVTDQFTTKLYPRLNRATRKAMEAVRLGEASKRAQDIKLADLIDNTGSIVELDTSGFAQKYLFEKEILLSKLTLGDRGLWERASAQTRG